MSEVHHTAVDPKFAKLEPEGKLIAHRGAYKPPLPPVLRDIKALKFTLSRTDLYKDHEEAQRNSLKQVFPLSYGQPLVTFAQEAGGAVESRPLKIGVVLSGGQAPGGHTVISGIFDALQELNPQSELIGFRDGPAGLLKNRYVRLTSTIIQRYRHTGGFDMIASGRTKIQSKDDFHTAKLTTEANDLDGVVVIGGDDSNTNMAHLAEYFKSHKCKATCVGVPKTIDGDLSNDQIEASFGFDTACKVYANEVANICRDARSARKYWFFIKMMGRSASHVTLEVASMTQPNLALIGEEVAAKKMSLADITSMIADVVAERAKLGRHYGVVLIPEGVVEFVPEVQELILSLNRLLANKLHAMVLKALRKPELKTEYVMSELTGHARTCFAAMPLDIQIQLILDRDSHGNVNVSSIETERLFGEMVKQELEARKKKGTYKGSFDPKTHFCGYQGRAAFPSNFDTKYCYALGRVAVALIKNELSGYLSCVGGLARPVDQWVPKGVPITSMMCLEERHGKMEPVIKKALVDLNSTKFKYFESQREKWELYDSYLWVGPMQFFGPAELSEMTNYHLRSLL